MEIGDCKTVGAVVTRERTAQAVGSGDAPVLGTPALAALMENAALLLAAESLEEGQTTVGTHIAVSHTAATPLGMRFEATAALTAAEGRTLTFSMTARDETGPIGEGTQRRVIVDRARFIERTAQKRPT